MVISGTVQGEAARKYGEFTYRKPIPSHIDIWQLDPERVNPTQEFPRYVNPPRQPATKIVELADYEIEVSDIAYSLDSRVEVRLIANEYTEANEDRVVATALIGPQNRNTKFYEYVLEEAFRTGEQND